MDVLDEIRTPSWFLITALSMPRKHLSKITVGLPLWRLTSVLLFEHVQEVSHRVGYRLQSKHTELVPARQRNSHVGQTVDDGDVIDLELAGAKGGGGGGGAVEGGQQVRAVQRGETF